jgi:hypothetical protein
MFAQMLEKKSSLELCLLASFLEKLKMGKKWAKNGQKMGKKWAKNGQKWAKFCFEKKNSLQLKRRSKQRGLLFSVQ